MALTLSINIGGLIPIDLPEIKEICLVELLGVGGFGSVWKVSDTKTNKYYVLKLIKGLKEEILLERVKLEAGVAIESEFVVPVVGLREWDKTTYLILFEYYPGRSLDNVMRDTTLTSDQKRHIFDQILLGVADAHACNIIHRDIKPQNILILDDNYSVKLLDFGISKFVDLEIELTKSCEILGTLEYLAPEILRHGSKKYATDAKVDIYALGHLLYQLTTGQHFWKYKKWGNDINKFLEDYCRQPPFPTESIDISTFTNSFYPNGPEVLAKMVKISAEDRYDKVEDIIRDLGIIDVRKKSAATISHDNSIYWLVVESGSNKNSFTPISLKPNQELIIGRAHIAGNNDRISGKHLKFIRHSDGSYSVLDFNSTNGTLLNGSRLGNNPVTIKDQDRLKVADVFLRFTQYR